MSTSRFNFSQGGAEQIPTILRIFGRGVPFAGWLEGRGWPRKENYKSFDEACCVLKKKGHRRGRREGVDGVGSRRASSREIQLPLNKLIHCRRPSATFSMKQRSNNPLFLPSLEPLDTFHRLSFLFPLPFPHPFFPSWNMGEPWTDKLKHRLFSNSIVPRRIVVSLSWRGKKGGETNNRFD